MYTPGPLQNQCNTIARPHARRPPNPDQPRNPRHEAAKTKLSKTKHRALKFKAPREGPPHVNSDSLSGWRPCRTRARPFRSARTRAGGSGVRHGAAEGARPAGRDGAARSPPAQRLGPGGCVQRQRGLGPHRELRGHVAARVRVPVAAPVRDGAARPSRPRRRWRAAAAHAAVGAAPGRERRAGRARRCLAG